MKALCTEGKFVKLHLEKIPQSPRESYHKPHKENMILQGESLQITCMTTIKVCLNGAHRADFQVGGLKQMR